MRNAGHLFAFQGDLTRVACDAWLMPSDGRLKIVRRHWCETNPWPLPYGAGQARGGAPGASWGDRLVLPASEIAPDHDDPRDLWIGNVGRRGLTAAHAGRVTRAYLREALAALDGRERYVRRRERPLLAMPLIGTGMGGGRRRSAAVLEAVVEEAAQFVSAHRADVALVAHSAEDHAAIQGLRRARLGSKPPGSAWTLPKRLFERAAALAGLAAAGRLALFLGAGVSAGANLPLWGELLTALAGEADPFLVTAGDGPPRLAPDFAKLDALDQAAYLSRKLRAGGRDLRELVQRQILAHRAYSLAHGLLASLPVRECITTNYDDLFEQASEAAGNPCAVLPWHPAPDQRRWLLKMHGTVSDAQSIVLTRESYLRYGARNEALAGIVQATLITRHMLFVGFSMGDDNFHRIADAVRRAVGPHRALELGDVTAVSDFGFQRSLWEGELGWIDLFKASEGIAEAARRLEIFLDYLNFRAASSTHLLHERFALGLSEDERALRELVLQVREAWRQAPDRSAPGWRRVERFLRAFGYQEP